jgi:2-C-methyl-D-erythritol 4-phosphate cytidylyltransferase
VIVSPPPLAAVFPPPRAGEGQGEGITVLVTPVSDTCKEVVDGVVRRTVPRESLVTVTGPWAFTRQALTDALDRVAGRDRDLTGMVGLSEAARLTVRVVVGG